MQEEIPIKEIHSLVSRWNPTVSVAEISAMTPDASMRSYYRVRLEDSETLVVMQFHATGSPEHSGEEALGSDEAYVLLTGYFGNAGISVPELFFDDRDQGFLLIEDLGDTALADVAREGDTLEVRRYYELAIDQLLSLQSLPKDPELFAFRRGFGAQDYVREMREFSEFFLPSRGVSSPELSAGLSTFYPALAEVLASRPQVLAHRDFHSWNLLVHNRAVRVIDFQDALCATPEYDLVSLLHDRDTDALLGEENYEHLLHYFCSRTKASNDFITNFCAVALQRDLKVVGRFAKLSSTRGLAQYEQWIPGTLRRIGTSLKVLSQVDAELYSPIRQLLETNVEGLS